MFVPQEKEMKFAGGLSNIVDSKKTPFSPSQMMMSNQGLFSFVCLFVFFFFSFSLFPFINNFEQILIFFGIESSLLLLTPKDQKSIYHVDLERPDIVETWNTGSHDVSQLYQKSKFNQTTGDKLVLAMNEQGFFSFDLIL